MTEENIYDDCNWKNKPLTTAVQINGAWYNLDYMEFEHRQMKHINEGMKKFVFNDFFNFERALGHLGEEGMSMVFQNPNDPNIKVKSYPSQEFLRQISDLYEPVIKSDNPNIPTPPIVKITLSTSDIDANKNFYPKLSPDERSAFEKWGEGLEWGIPQRKTNQSDECSGDLILP